MGFLFAVELFLVAGGCGANRGGGGDKVGGREGGLEE